MKASFEKHLLKFKTPARTSRGSYIDKEVFLLHLTSNAIEALGEASPLPDLSIDDMEEKMEEVCTYLNQQKNIREIHEVLQLKHYPSIQFALECVFERLKYQQKNIFFPSAFTEKKTGIPINGLVWMEDALNMLKQVDAKVEQGYTYIKLKIGALDFDEECRMLELIRKKYSAHKITLRADANGAFETEDALQKLNELKRFELHSIEQPIAAKQYETMQQLCAESKIPIALDEDLIGINPAAGGEKLLKFVRPQYLILKPTLIGGFSICDQWIQLASKYNVGWWLTSALESNIGLNAIAQYCGKLNVSLPQGLGTGLLYENNFEATTEIRDGMLYYK
jgi:o-succinylbenzoate synthase